MKKLFALIMLSFLFCSVHATTEQDSVLSSLYNLIKNKEPYMMAKEQKIAEIKKLLLTPDLRPTQQYEINKRLNDEYKTYLADSAIIYIRKNLEIAEKLNSEQWVNESKLYLASLYSLSGMYIDSYNMLNSLNRKDLPEHLWIDYYDSYKSLYERYLVNNIHAAEYKQRSDIYRDSLLMVLDSQSNHYKIVYAEKLTDTGQLNEAKEMLQDMFDKSIMEDHEMAVLAYAIACIYREKGDIDNQKKYFAISAICDIKNSIKENASLQALAAVLFETKDIEHAYICVKSSMEDAMFCNARLRTYEVSKIFPIIDSAYQDKVTKQKEELKHFLIMISILSVFLLIAVIYVYYQMRRVARIRKELYRTNVKLNQLNGDLQNSNDQLNDLNTELSEANRIKETYIGHFLDLCSTYISKLEKYQNTLNKKAVAKKMEELYKMLKSNDMIDNELRELFENFDNIFLHLYPNFVEQFNSLLLPEERFKLKPNELLNTELRIFALIRLGITDSSKIASFLHYSANTIYNYRTRVRNKAAVPREEFEAMVMKIALISK